MVVNNISGKYIVFKLSLRKTVLSLKFLKIRLAQSDASLINE